MHTKMLDKLVTEEDYRRALKRFIELCSSRETEQDLKELLVLMDMMEKYERENCSAN